MRGMIFMKNSWVLPTIMLLFVITGALGSTVVAEEKIVATIYYSAKTTCGTCVKRNMTLTTLQQNYSDTITFIRKNYDNQTIKEEALDLGVTGHPSMVVVYQDNTTVINPSDIPTTTTDDKFTILETHLNNYVEAYTIYNAANPDSSSEVFPLEILLVPSGIAVLIILAVVMFFVWKKEQS